MCPLLCTWSVLTLPPSTRSHIRIRGPHDGDAGARAAAEGRTAATFAHACCEVQALAWEVLAADDSEDEAHEAAQMILMAGTSDGSSQSL